MSELRYLYMIRSVESLRALVKEKMQLLKMNKYLADADWIFIEKNFQIENPHTANMTNNDSRQINSINNNLQCSNCYQPLSMEFNQTQNDDLLEVVRIRIINLQKVVVNLSILDFIFLILLFRQAFGDNTEVMKFQHKLFGFYRLFLILPLIEKVNILVLINLNIIISENNFKLYCSI